MTIETLERRFAEIGARVKVTGPPVGDPRIDVRPDRRGEFFDVRFAGGVGSVELEVVDVDRAGRHLLLLTRDGQDKSKFLCGYDERHWFVAAVPENARGVTGVRAAKMALQPELVHQAIGRARPRDPLRRRNTAYVRQGEWFFVPAPEARWSEADALRNEPLSRERGQAHTMEFAYRLGGEMGFVNDRHPGGLTQAKFAALPERQRKGEPWRQMVRDAEVFAMGAIRHPDHATVHLTGWHRC
jgi:hypothetical protein